MAACTVLLLLSAAGAARAGHAAPRAPITGLGIPTPSGVGITGFTVAPSLGEVGVPANFTVATAGASGSLDYTYVGLPPYCAGANLSVLPCAPTVPGSYRVQVFVNDSAGGGANASLVWVVAPRLAVGPLNVTPPVTDSYQGISITLGSAGGVKPFTVTWSGLPDECLPNGSAYIHCYPGDARYFLITGYITDARGVAGQAATLLDVVAPPNVTRLLAIPDNITLGQSVTFVTLGRAGSGVPTYAYSGLPPGCVSANVTYLTCTPTVNGTYVVTVIETDQFLGASERNVVVNVTRPAVPAPWLAAFVADPSRISLGESTTFVSVLVNGSPPWNVSYSGLPPGCATAPLLDLTCTPNATGNFSVRFTAMDGTGARVVAYAALQVFQPPPPILVPPGALLYGGSGLIVAVVGGLAGLGAGFLIGRTVDRRRGPLPE